MVRKKSRPSFFSETQCQDNSWSLSGIEISSCELEVLNLLEKSRVLAAESTAVQKSKTKDDKNSPRKRAHRETCADIGNCYLEEVLAASETSLTAACVVKLYIRAHATLILSFNLIKLRERRFKLKSISSLNDMREMLITHEKQSLLYDFVDDHYSLRLMTDSDPSNVSFSLVDPIYPDLQVFQAAASLSKLSAIFICLSVDQRQECLIIEEFLNSAFAADTETSNVLMKKSKAMTIRKLTHFKVFFNYVFAFRDEDLIIANSEHPEVIAPEDLNDILSFSQMHRGKDYFRTEERDQSAHLLPKLRPYQIAASKWMLQRERNPVQCFANKIDPSMHAMYRKVKIPMTTNNCSEQTMHIYVNIFSGSFHLSPPSSSLPVAGGVIADEMGLGKTLEVLEVILRNARPLETISSPSIEKHIEFQNVMSKLREGEDEKLQLGGDAGNIELSCVCGIVDYDEGDVGTIRKLGVPLRCNECSCWIHPFCMNIKQTTVEIHTNRVKPTRKKVFLTPENYICPFCVVQRKTLVKVPATLVISPASICDQWCEEIDKHVEEGALKVLVYKGVRSKQKFIQPEDFLNYDVVITTFEVLRAELNHSDLHDDNTESPSKRSNVPQQALLEADPHPCRLRRAKRYRSLPTPLVCVEWWRICVDEAQTIEAHTAKATEMLLKLHCVNKWCVTGTLIHRNVEDLFGVMLFLQVDPLCVHFWWNEFVKKKLNPSTSTFASDLIDDKNEVHVEDTSKVAKPTEIDCTVLLQALRCFVWRTCKKDVRDQIAIPTQYIHIRKLKFSPIEAHFYNMKKRKCAKKAHLSAICAMDSSSMLNQIDKAAAKKVLIALGDLRKACVHPQMVHGHAIGGLNNRNGGRLMTMDELLAEMKVKAVRECEESLRQICCSINGIAGVEMLMNNSLKAVELYREVLRRTTAYAAEGIRSDYLPKIHTLYNLHLLLNSLPERMVEPTPRDSELMTECNKLKLEYLTTFDKDTETAKVKWIDTRDKITSLRQQFDSNSWLADLCESVLDDNLDNLLIERVYADLQKNAHTMSESFRNIVGLEYYVYTSLEKILSTREKCCKAVQDLDVVLSDQIVSSCYECHLKPEITSPSQVGQKKPPVKRPKCTHCKVHDSLIEYENLIFGSALQSNLSDSHDWDTDLVDDSEAVKGVEDNVEQGPSSSASHSGIPKSVPEKWNPSRVEVICGAISAFAEAYALPETDVKSSKFVRNMFDLMKREFKFLRSFWRCLYDRVSAHDELRMATERIRLLNKDEDPNILNQAPSNILHPHMLPQTHKRLQNELSMFETELMERRGRKAYLANLDKAKNLNRNTELCPVCRTEFDKQWSVFACGHSFCLRCVGILLDDPQHSNASSFDDLSLLTMSSRKTKVKCPVCRQVSPLATISYVKTQCKQQSQMDVQVNVESENREAGASTEVEVKGDLSAKTHAIVETIVSTLASEPPAKFLVFSTWLEVLNILSSALEMNHVPHLTLTPGHTFKTVLTKFKSGCSSLAGENLYPVMLMQYKSSSSGLNIIEANHVIIVEPVLTPAVVHQAIGRVDRISQTRETHVHLFIIEDTVEDQICQLITQFKETNGGSSEVSGKATTPAISLENIKQMFD